MTRRQKRVILIMAVIDLLVIGGLASYAIFSGVQNSAGSSPDIPQSTRPADDRGTCAALLLHELGDDGLLITVRWDDVRALIQIHAYPSEISDAQTAPPQQTETQIEPSTASNAQVLWQILDRLPHPLPDICRVPEIFTLLVCIQDDTHQQCHIMTCQGADLAAWLTRDLSDEEFARGAHYREIRVP